VENAGAPHLDFEMWAFEASHSLTGSLGLNHQNRDMDFAPPSLSHLRAIFQQERILTKEEKLPRSDMEQKSHSAEQD
jgi:hypothetical protein